MSGLKFSSTIFGLFLSFFTSLYHYVVWYWFGMILNRIWSQLVWSKTLCSFLYSCSCFYFYVISRRIPVSKDCFLTTYFPGVKLLGIDIKQVWKIWRWILILKLVGEIIYTSPSFLALFKSWNPKFQRQWSLSIMRSENY